MFREINTSLSGMCIIQSVTDTYYRLLTNLCLIVARSQAVDSGTVADASVADSSTMLCGGTITDTT